MKVLLVILHADGSRGGAEAYTVTLFHKLLEAGHDARLAAATFEAGVPRDRRVPLQFRGLTRLRRYGRFVKSLDRHLDGGEHDVVHAMLPVRRCDVYHPHAGLEAVGWEALPFSRRIGNPRRRAYVTMERRLLAQPTPPLTLCLSNAARTAAATRFDRPDRFVTLYSGVDESRFAPPPPRPARTPPACVFVGQDFARKGLDIAIRAVALHPSATLRVVGHDDAFEFIALATRCGIGHRVSFVGATRDVATQLREADVLLLPSRREPFGMVAVEAMLCGVPPVVSATAGVAELIDDDADGRVVAGEDPKAWAAAIDSVLREREPRSAACRARRERLSYAHHLRTLLALYERTAAERR